MSRQPYTYSMPESFLKDKSVPARWRVLAVVNGFILNGGCFYGSNEWLMEQLDCSQHTISSAFTELEQLGEIRTERTKRTRKVYKTSRDSNQLLSEIATEHVRDSNQLLPNSVSNSEREYTDSLRSSEPLEEVKTYEREDGEKKEPSATKQYATLCSWLEGLTGVKIINRAKQYAHLKKARAAGIPPGRLKERAQELVEEPFYQEHGLDWGSVISSFDRRA